MRVLIFHGYLLHGTGSNIYNANLAVALVRAGHEVHLLCQERALDLPWIDAEGDWDAGELTVRARREPVQATVYRPDIGPILPVYVADRYPEIDARPFFELDDAQVSEYVERNVRAVRDVAARIRPDLALANHVVMGPLVLARALDAVPYAVKIHGSALEYVVKPHPRFLPAAREGLAGARGVLVGSRHTARSLWAAIEEPALADRTRLSPPGVDVEAFVPRPPAQAQAALAALCTRIAAATEGHGEGSFARDPREAAAALAGLDARRDQLVLFVGKLIASKGVELLLHAWPSVARAAPAAKLVIVGFGEDRARLESLAGSLGVAARWTGRLEHDELAALLPAASALVVPSTFPEAFGMVAAEAAACGVLPIVARHSGLEEVADVLAATVPEAVTELLSFPLEGDPAGVLAQRLTTWLAAGEDLRAATRDALAASAREHWSWERVARSVVAAAQGDLDGLPPV